MRGSPLVPMNLGLTFCVQKFDANSESTTDVPHISPTISRNLIAGHCP
jgi:hypothetical protein